MICQYCKRASKNDGLCNDCLDHCQGCDDAGCIRPVCGRNMAHYCPDWDYLLIHSGHIEIESCTCRL